MLPIIDTSVSHEKETMMNLTSTLRNLQVRNQCTCKKSFECEKIKVFQLNAIILLSINTVKLFNL